MTNVSIFFCFLLPAPCLDSSLKLRSTPPKVRLTLTSLTKSHSSRWRRLLAHALRIVTVDCGLKWLPGGPKLTVSDSSGNPHQPTLLFPCLFSALPGFTFDAVWLVDNPCWIAGLSPVLAYGQIVSQQHGRVNNMWFLCSSGKALLKRAYDCFWVAAGGWPVKLWNSVAQFLAPNVFSNPKEKNERTVCLWSFE